MSANMKLPEAREIAVRTHVDHRGYFRETFRETAEGELARFVQDNESLSLKPGVLRGLHFQRPPKAQAKLVRVAAGAVFDVVVDLRRGSEHFGRWRSFILSAEKGSRLFVPEGFAHGFCALADNTVVEYKVSEYYDAEADAGLRWNDPALGIAWPEGLAITVSDKDAALPLFSELGAIF